MQQSLFAYNGNLAYVSLDKVDHITIHMKDGSTTTSTGVSVEPTTVNEPQVTAPVRSNVGSVPTYHTASADTGSLSQGYATSGSGSGLSYTAVRSGSATSNSSTTSGSANNTQILLEKALLRLLTTSDPTPQVTVNSPAPKITVQTPSPTVVQQGEQTTNNFYDYVTKTYSLENSSLNNGTIVDVDYSLVMQELLDTLQTDPDFAQQILSGAGLTINANTVNNANNEGNIISDSEDVTVVDISKANVDVTTNTVGSYNTDSGNTTVVNSNNDITANSGNTTTTTSTSTTNTNCNNTIDATLENVGNDYSTTTADIDVTETNVTVEDSGNTIASGNTVSSNNDTTSSSTTNSDSNNTDCDGNGNTVEVEQPQQPAPQ